MARPQFENRSGRAITASLRFASSARMSPSRKGVISIEGKPELKGRELLVPGDLSSAASILVAAMIVPDSELVLQAVGLNPTRAALIDFLVGIGADIRAEYRAKWRRADRQPEREDRTYPGRCDREGAYGGA